MPISKSLRILDPSTCGIYSITCIPTGKIYVGHAQNMKSRWKKHQDDLFKRQHSSKELQEAYDIYGLHEFRFKTLETGVEPGSLDERELHWMTVSESHRRGFNSQTEFDQLTQAVNAIKTA